MKPDSEFGDSEASREAQAAEVAAAAVDDSADGESQLAAPETGCLGLSSGEDLVRFLATANRAGGRAGS